MEKKSNVQKVSNLCGYYPEDICQMANDVPSTRDACKKLMKKITNIEHVFETFSKDPNLDVSDFEESIALAVSWRDNFLSKEL